MLIVCQYRGACSCKTLILCTVPCSKEQSKEKVPSFVATVGSTHLARAVVYLFGALGGMYRLRHQRFGYLLCPQVADVST